MSVLASLFLVGCSQKEIVPGGEDNGKGSGSSFINVNLVSYGNGTRAISPYEDGTDEDNKGALLLLHRNRRSRQREAQR